MLCDTGPLIALIDRDDRHHGQCVAALASLPASPLVTTWPCLTEAMHLLHRVGGLRAQNELWGFIVDGLVQIYAPSSDEWRQMQALMNQYAGMPLDLADASLVTAAERLSDWSLFSLDSRLRAVHFEGLRGFAVLP